MNDHIEVVSEAFIDGLWLRLFSEHNGAERLRCVLTESILLWTVQWETDPTSITQTEVFTVEISTGTKLRFRMEDPNDTTAVVTLLRLLD